MKKRALKKLSSQVGESIAEVLIALLISVLGVAMLAGMVGASSRVIMRSTKVIQDQYAKTAIVHEKTTGDTVSIVGTAIKNISVWNRKHDGQETVYYQPNRNLAEEGTHSNEGTVEENNSDGTS